MEAARGVACCLLIGLWSCGFNSKRNLINILNDEICGLTSESGKTHTRSILLYEMSGSVEDMYIANYPAILAACTVERWILVAFYIGQNPPILLLLTTAKVVF
jgi:hypothetical protein